MNKTNDRRACRTGAIAFLLVATLFRPAASLYAAEKPAVDKSVFKASYISIWCDTDASEGCPEYDVDVLIQDVCIVDDADVPRWKKFIDQQHAAGKLVCVEMRPLTHMGRMLEYALNDPGLQAAACLDLDLKPIPIGWMKEGPYHATVPPFYCSNHPNYHAFLRQQMEYFVQVGADGVMVDDGGGSPFAYRHGGCFCEYCIKGFREYLKKKYSIEQLRKKGVDDPESFDYRQYVLQRFGGLDSYKKLMRQGRGGPLSGDFQRFLRVSDVELFRYLQAYSSQLRGRNMPMGWDNVDCREHYSPYYPFWDVFYSEITYQNFHVDGRGPADVFPHGIIYLDKLADALDMWYTPTPGPRGWQAIMEGNLTGLLRQWIAFTYANGGALRYPRKGWVFSNTTPWYYPPKKEFEPVYAFIRTHPELFDDYEPVQQVGVLYSQKRQSGYYTPLKHICASLVDLNIPFGLAIAGDEALANRLTGDEVDRFDVMLIPEPVRLIDGQQEIVNRWKAKGKAITVKRSDNVAEKIADHVKSLVAVENDSNVWLFPRTLPGKADAPLVCHVINAQYSAGPKSMVKQEGVVASFSRSLWKEQPPGKVTYHTIGRPARVLPLAADTGKVQVTIPEVDLWGILAFDNAAGWTELFDGKTLNGWVQKNGTAPYRVMNGTIVGRTAEESWNSFLCTEKEYGDFELEFEVKVDAGLNTGVQIRSKTRDKTVGEGPNNAAGRVIGPQVEIESSGRDGAEAGYVYSEGTGQGWLTPKDRLIPHKHFNDGQWNHYRIVAKGPHIQTWINSILIEDLTNEKVYAEFPRGFIGLQVHRIRSGRGPYEVAWRNIRIREL